MVDRVPLTFPAHQSLVLPLKLWRPRWFDGVALVVGSGSPDLFNALSTTDTFRSHELDGLLVAVVFTVMYSTLLRRYSADGLFGSLPDLGPLQARNYRVLARGRPRFLVTVFSAFVGVASHIFIDSFTHAGRFGSNLLGLNDVLFNVAIIGMITTARLFQYIGHTAGSLIGVILFVKVVSRRHLADWYGHEQIQQARNAPVRPNAPRRLVLTVAIALIIGAVWGIVLDQSGPIFHMGLTLTLALLIGGYVNAPRLDQTIQPVDLGSDPTSMDSASGTIQPVDLGSDPTSMDSAS